MRLFFCLVTILSRLWKIFTSNSRQNRYHIPLYQLQKCPQISPHPAACPMREQKLRIAAGTDIGNRQMLRLYSGFQKNNLIGPPQV